MDQTVLNCFSLFGNLWLAVNTASLTKTLLDCDTGSLPCIVCHYDVVHNGTPLLEEFDAIIGSY